MCNFTLSRVKIHKKVKICNFCTKILNNFKQYQQSWLLIKCQKYCSIYTYHNKQSFFISLCLGLLLRQNTPDRDTASRSFFIILHALLHFPQARLCLLYPKAVFSLSCRGFPRLWGNIKRSGQCGAFYMYYFPFLIILNTGGSSGSIFARIKALETTTAIIKSTI